MESLQHSYLEIKNINITMMTHCMNPPTMERVMFLWWKHWSTWKKRIMHWQEKKSAFIHHFFWNLWRPKPEGGGRPEDREESELSEGGEEQWGDGTVLFTTASMLLMWMCVECSFLAVLSAVLHCLLHSTWQGLLSLTRKQNSVSDTETCSCVNQLYCT